MIYKIPCPYNFFYVLNLRLSAMGYWPCFSAEVAGICGFKANGPKLQNSAGWQCTIGLQYFFKHFCTDWFCFIHYSNTFWCFCV
ncbi:hypothetical protein GDO86_020068 [Hymenochirus boettgeri]|uniref:Uncharacterized protein n=1 Tax=Hymenochirus boettgeri TaxID=247094 RepID=A0A8T2IGD6_9PIPI|nr:hypothetical protein GDO86_020068 [Hymenochirus boettgeri]